MKNRDDIDKLLRYNIAVLAQALDVIDAHANHAAEIYQTTSGAHLRHLIEHYEALVGNLEQRSVNYDARARDLALERDPKLARQRLLALQQFFRTLDPASAAEPIAVQLRCGLGGEDNVVSFSSLARELQFLASHAVHHYALIQLRCAAHDIPLGENFGKAPATVKHATQA